MSSIAEAVEIASKAGDAWDCEHLRSEIARAQALAGENRAALATARGSKGSDSDDRLLADISVLQCEKDNFREAIATGREISRARGRSAAFAHMARYNAEHGNTSGAGQAVVLALEAAGAITDDIEHAMALVKIAAVQFDDAAR